MLRRLRVLAIAAAAVLVLVYLGDYLALRYRIPGHREPLGTVVMQQYYAVKLKNRKTEFLFDDPAPQPCVNSLFPHYGDLPCWYAERNKLQRVDIDSSAGSDFWRRPTER